MAYTKVFDNPYPDGWEDLPSEKTPLKASALQEHTDAIEHIEDYLEDYPPDNIMESLTHQAESGYLEGTLWDNSKCTTLSVATFNNDGSITINATSSTSHRYISLFNNTSSLDGCPLEKGKTYSVNLVGAENVLFQAYYTNASGNQFNLISGTSGKFTFPTNSVGAMIRLLIPKNIEINETVFVSLIFGDNIPTKYYPYVPSNLSLKESLSQLAITLNPDSNGWCFVPTNSKSGMIITCISGGESTNNGVYAGTPAIFGSNFVFKMRDMYTNAIITSGSYTISYIQL